MSRVSCWSLYVLLLLCDIVLQNPTDRTITKTVSIPLYYAGIENTANVIVCCLCLSLYCLQNDKNESTIYKLNRDYSIDMTFTMEPESFTYYVIQNKDE